MHDGLRGAGRPMMNAAIVAALKPHMAVIEANVYKALKAANYQRNCGEWHIVTRQVVSEAGSL